MRAQPRRCWQLKKDEAGAAAVNKYKLMAKTLETRVEDIKQHDRHLANVRRPNGKLRWPALSKMWNQ